MVHFLTFFYRLPQLVRHLVVMAFDIAILLMVVFAHFFFGGISRRVLKEHLARSLRNVRLAGNFYTLMAGSATAFQVYGLEGSLISAVLAFLLTVLYFGLIFLLFNSYYRYELARP